MLLKCELTEINGNITNQPKLTVIQVDDKCFGDLESTSSATCQVGKILEQDFQIIKHHLYKSGSNLEYVLNDHR